MGIILAFTIIIAWALHLAFMLSNVELSAANPWMYLHIMIQGYLYTGLFITGHDAMHGTVSGNKTVNKTIGTLAVFLFAGLSYRRLKKNHEMHHRFPAEKDDPDFYTGSQNFWIWWGVFMRRYLTIGQLIIMAAAFNIFIHILRLDNIKVILYWALPAILGTLQLFYFGVYQPHRLPHKENMMPHRARTQPKNHTWAMLSCYFFGYHYEHHADPSIPWWKLHQTKQPRLPV
jgi:beta-carotene/zeaxanthin 4-ketolase